MAEWEVSERGDILAVRMPDGHVMTALGKMNLYDGSPCFDDAHSPRDHGMIDTKQALAIRGNSAWPW